MAEAERVPLPRETSGFNIELDEQGGSKVLRVELVDAVGSAMDVGVSCRMNVPDGGTGVRTRVRVITAADDGTIKEYFADETLPDGLMLCGTLADTVRRAIVLTNALSGKVH